MRIDLVQTYKQLCADVAQYKARPYIVMDGAWQEQLTTKVRAHDHGWEPLMGTSAERKQDAHRRSPLLVDLEQHEYALKGWLDADFKAKIGILIFSHLPIEELRRSLKRFIHVITPESQKPVYFRFYDARTLYCFMRHGFTEQWSDFFRDITLIAAPFDYSPGWALYRVKEGAFHFATQKSDQPGWNWRSFENSDHKVEHYRSTFPWRSIQQQQYDDMIRCAELSFYHEVRDILNDVAQDLPSPDPIYSIKKIENLVKISLEFRCHDEPAKIYFCIMAYLFGDEFYQMPEFHQYMQNEYQLPEELFAPIIDEYANDINSKKLKSLAKSWLH